MKKFTRPVVAILALAGVTLAAGPATADDTPANISTAGESYNLMVRFGIRQGALAIQVRSAQACFSYMQGLSDHGRLNGTCANRSGDEIYRILCSIPRDAEELNDCHMIKMPPTQPMPAFR